MLQMGKILLANVREIVKRLWGKAALLLTHLGKYYEELCAACIFMRDYVLIAYS